MNESNPRYVIKVLENGKWVTKIVTRDEFLQGAEVVRGSRSGGISLAATVVAYRLRLIFGKALRTW